MAAFASLSEKLNHIFSKMTKRGRLTELEIKQAMREVRIALLEADVNINVVKQFTASVSEKAVGQEILKSLSPTQQVVKIVNEELIALMGEKNVMEKCASSVIIRTAWLYSSFGNNFVKTMIRLGRERKELGVVFDQIGTPTYARDLAKAIIAILDKGIVPGVYHYSNEGVTSWYDFAKNIHRIAGVEGVNLKPLHTYEYPVPAKRPYYSVLDKTKIKQAYSIEIPYWMDSLEECIAVLSLS